LQGGKATIQQRYVIRQHTLFRISLSSIIKKNKTKGVGGFRICENKVQYREFFFNMLKKETFNMLKKETMSKGHSFFKYAHFLHFQQ
jgi:hypothetical protein